MPERNGVHKNGTADGWEDASVVLRRAQTRLGKRLPGGVNTVHSTQYLSEAVPEPLPPVAPPPPPDSTPSGALCTVYCVNQENDYEYLKDVYAEAVQKPFPEAAAGFLHPAVQRLVALCWALQQNSKSGVFYLSCRSVGELLGVSHVTGAKYLGLLCKTEVIVCVKRYDEKERQANVYRWRL